MGGCATPEPGAANQPGQPGETGQTNQSEGENPPAAVPGGDGPSIPNPGGSDPVDLINMWRVTADGETPDTWLRLDAFSYELWRPCGPISGSWAADDANFIATEPWGMVEPCSFEDDFDIPWLQATVAYTGTTEGWAFLDAAGNITATLRVDGIPPEHPNVWDEGRQPPEITDAVRAALAEPTPLAAAYRAPEPGELVGYWLPLQTFTTRPFAEFDANGTWTGSDGCNGMMGAWRLGTGGRLLVTSGPMTAMGCEGVPIDRWVGGAARVGFDGDVLVTFDNTGAELGRLVRSEPLPTPTSVTAGSYDVGLQESDGMVTSFRMIATAEIPDSADIIYLDAGCNNINVPILEGNVIGIAAATMMMCPDMENESALLTNLPAGAVIEFGDPNNWRNPVFTIGNLQFSPRQFPDLPLAPIVPGTELPAGG